MLVRELVEKIYFHDSGVNKLVYENGTVILDIDLCLWMQEGYKTGDPELQNVILKFLNCTNYNWDSEKKEEDIDDCDEIINIGYEGRTFEMLIIDYTKDEDLSTLTFECEEVEIEYKQIVS